MPIIETLLEIVVFEAMIERRHVAEQSSGGARLPRSMETAERLPRPDGSAFGDCTCRTRTEEFFGEDNTLKMRLWHRQ